jgi:hypothetical protein
MYADPEDDPSNRDDRMPARRQLSGDGWGDEASHDERQRDIVQRRREQVDPGIVDGVHCGRCHQKCREQPARYYRAWGTGKQLLIL